MTSGVLQKAFEWLDAEFQKADAPRASLQGKKSAQDCLATLSASVAREPSLRKAIDETMREWISGRPPMQTSREVTLLIYDRVVEAHGFCQWALASGLDMPGGSKQQVLELLLVEYWSAVGVLRWKARLVDLQRICET